MNVYKKQINLYTTNKLIWCKVFLTFLKEEALNRFTQLPTNSMDSLKPLAAKFNTQCAISQPHHMSTSALFNVSQEKGEPLQTFMERFNKLSLSIKNLMPKITMHHLILALRPGQFTNSLVKKPTNNLNELRNWATKFMQIEELHDFHKNARAHNDIRHIPGQFDKIRDNRGPRFHTYTPLNADRGKIMGEALHIDLILTLKKLQGL